MATPAPPLTRAQYLQVREKIRTLTAVAKNLPLGDFVAAIDRAEKAGPVQEPKMWTEGGAQLAKDRALAAALAAYVAGV